MIVRIHIDNPQSAKTGFLTWDSPPLSVHLDNAGKVAFYFHNKQGHGPKLKGCLAGMHHQHGVCVSLTVAHEEVPAIFDFVRRSQGRFALNTLNTKEYLTLHKEWNYRNAA